MNDRSEKEQLEEIRTWWAENGRYVIAGVVLGIAAILGWNQWRSNVESTRIEASNLYEEVMSSVGSGDVEAAEAAARSLYLDYQGTVYPHQARLAMARLYMDQGRDQDAAEALREVLASGENDEIQMVARLRLAKILLYQEKSVEVIELLTDHVEGGFAARYNELLGDAFAAEGRYEDARQAYRAALSESRNLRTIDNNLLLLKLNDLPEDLGEMPESPASSDDGESGEDAAEEQADESPPASEAGPGVESATENDRQR